MHLRVATINATKFFEIRAKDNGVYEGIGGINFELLKILSSALNFTYDLVIPKDGRWGSLTEDGKWTGMVGMLERNEADMAINSLTLTYARSQVTDNAFPNDVDYDSFMIKKSGTASQTFFFVRPFQPTVWSLFMLSIFLCSGILSILHSSFGHRQQSRERGWSRMLSMMEILIGNHDFGHFLRSGVSKIFFILSAFPLRVLMFSFTGLLLSFLIAPLKLHQIKTFEELSEACRSSLAKVTTFKGNNIDQELQKAEKGILKVLGEHFRAHPESSVLTETDAIEKTMTGYALMDSKSYLTVLVSEVGLEDDIFISQDSLKIAPEAILFRKNFCCVKTFDKMILRIYQSGLYQKLMEDLFFRLGLKGKLNSEPEENLKSITVSDLRAVFGLLIFGYIIAIITLFSERYIYRKVNRIYIS